MPHAVRSHASAPGLRRLALAAAAREVDDIDVVRVRKLFQALELQCDGPLTREALVEVARGSGTLCATASALAKAFGQIDIDGSGELDWTELVAIALSAGGIIRSDTQLGFQDQVAGMPPLRDDVCWRSFDLLSESSSVLTAAALCRVLTSCTGGMVEEQEASLEKLDHMVKEVAVSGSVTPARFLALLHGSDAGNVSKAREGTITFADS